MYPASNRGLNRETAQAIYFFTNAFYPLDNFSAHQIKIWNKSFPTAEHAFQWKKYSSTYPKISLQILNASSPHVVKEISDSNKSKVSSRCHMEKLDVMRQILITKFKQHEDVREVLKKTGKKNIIENSPVDNFWGNGSNGKGQNHIGRLWMEIREEFLE